MTRPEWVEAGAEALNAEGGAPGSSRGAEGFITVDRAARIARGES